MKEMVGGAAIWYASANFTRDLTIAYIGVPLNVLVACAIGSFCSFSFSEKIDSRRRMVSLFLTGLLMGAAFTSILNGGLVHFLSLEMTDGLQAGLGAAVSFVIRFFLPWLVDVVKTGKWLSWVPFGRRE